MSVCLTTSISVVPTGHIYVKFDWVFHENLSRKSKLIRQKRALYVKIKVCSIVAGNIKSL